MKITNKQLKNVKEMIKDTHKMYVFTHKEYKYIEDIYENVGKYWDACCYINNIIINTNILKTNNDKLYKIIHELAHGIMHNFKPERMDQEHLCVNELEAEQVARRVMEELGLEYNKSRIQIVNTERFEGVIDDDGKMDYLEYHEYEMNLGIFKDEDICRTIRLDYVDRVIRLLVLEIQKVI